MLACVCPLSGGHKRKKKRKLTLISSKAGGPKRHSCRFGHQEIKKNMQKCRIESKTLFPHAWRVSSLSFPLIFHVKGCQIPITQSDLEHATVMHQSSLAAERAERKIFSNKKIDAPAAAEFFSTESERKMKPLNLVRL